MEVRLNSPLILTKMEFNRVKSCLTINFLLRFKDMDCWSWHLYIFSATTKCHWSTSGYLLASKIDIWQCILTSCLLSTCSCYSLKKDVLCCSSGLTDRGKGQRLITLHGNRFDSRVTDWILILSWCACNSHLCKSRARPGIFSSLWEASGNITSSASCLTWSMWLLEDSRQDTVVGLLPWCQTGLLWNQWTAWGLPAEIDLENKGENA